MVIRPETNVWVGRIPEIQEMVDEGVTCKELGDHYGVSKQRIYQVLTKYGIQTPEKERKNFLRGKGPEYYWLNKMLGAKGFQKQERMLLLEAIKPPKYCPMLGIELNYHGTGKDGWTARGDDSPSIDRIDSSEGYTKDNIQIISWRANRIKNDGTWQELLKIGNYLRTITK